MNEWIPFIICLWFSCIIKYLYCKSINITFQILMPATFCSLACRFLQNTDFFLCSRYRPGVAQRVCRGIALLFRDRGTRRGWVVRSTPRPHFTPGKDPVPIVKGAGWAPGPVWTGGKSRPHRDSIPDRPARSQSLYRLSYRAHKPLILQQQINRLANRLKEKPDWLVCNLLFT